MKQFFVNCCLLLLFGQINLFGAKLCQTDGVNPLTLLKPSLTLQANIYYGDQDEESSPITETDFYLLDKSLVKILKDSNFKPEFEGEKERSLEVEDYLTATAKTFSSANEESEIVALLLKKEISKHQSFTLKTNLRGQAKVKSAKTGEYYLFGIGKADGEILVWHFPVNIRVGSNVIEVDQHNTSVVFAADE
jgi:hypothetical protein